MFNKIYILILLALLIIVASAFAGTFTPTPSSPGASYYTLSDIYNKISAGTSAPAHTFDPATTPAETFVTLSQIWNIIPPHRTLATHGLDSGILSSGIYSATTSLVTIEPNLIAANIATGTSIFGVKGTRVVYTVTYNGNGNTGGNIPIDSNSYSSGNTVTVLDNTGALLKTGYNFTGWNTQADGNGTNHATRSTFTMDSANVNLYAKWGLIGTPLTDCGTISSPGTYILQNDILDAPIGQNCFNITASNVTLNGGGYRISRGRISQSVSGIYANNVSNLAITNITINSFCKNGIYTGCGGIFFENVSNSLIDSLTINAITGGFPNGGILFHYGSGNTISNNTLSNNKGEGISGIRLDASNNNTISNNILTNNDNGFRIYQGSTGNVLSGNTESGSLQFGLDLSSSNGNTFSGSFTSNQNRDINCSSSNTNTNAGLTYGTQIGCAWLP